MKYYLGGGVRIVVHCKQLTINYLLSILLPPSERIWAISRIEMRYKLTFERYYIWYPYLTLLLYHICTFYINLRHTSEKIYDKKIKTKQNTKINKKNSAWKISNPHFSAFSASNVIGPSIYPSPICLSWSSTHTLVAKGRLYNLFFVTYLLSCFELFCFL